jgi:hypothetical protein
MSRDDFKVLNGIPLSERTISLMAMPIDLLMRTNLATGWVRPVPLPPAELSLLRRAARVWPRRLRVDGEDEAACNLDRRGLVVAFENASIGITAVECTLKGTEYPGVWVKGRAPA